MDTYTYNCILSVGTTGAADLAGERKAVPDLRVVDQLRERPEVAHAVSVERACTTAGDQCMYKALHNTEAAYKHCIIRILCI